MAYIRMLLLTFYFIVNSFAAPCQQKGYHMVTCKPNSCERVGVIEICVQCRAGGVPINGQCSLFDTSYVAEARCTKSDGTALTSSDTTCGKCGGEYFLFMGGCYGIKYRPGNEICTRADDGKCTTCNTGNSGKYVFKNGDPNAAPGTECILCHDTMGANGYTGVANCAECSHAGTSSGAATCGKCQTEYFKSGDTCTPCGADCWICESTAKCTVCKYGKYIKENGNDRTCVDTSGCGTGNYADIRTNECKPCTDTSVNECATCTYSDTLRKPVCTGCNSGGAKPLLKVDLDGSATCVAEGECASGNTHFLEQSPKACVPCGDAKNGGILGCSTCSSKTTCTKCLDGYYNSGNGGTVTCTACGANCATCSAAGNDQCTKCKPGFFMKQPGSAGKCFACDSKADNGIEGCSQCNSGLTPTCTDCKSNYRKEGTNPVKCTKACEDPTACGGTSGACGAVVVDSAGAFSQYCSLCGDPATFPIDGVCTGDKGGNTCANGVCTRCAAGFFLFMGGCYDVSKAPGSHMCKSAEGGRCTVPGESGRYFIVPGASSTDQSVLTCSNPVGTLTGTGSTAKAYVGVYGCSACTTPVAPSDGGMTAAVCTACNNNNKPNLAGSECLTCTVSGCSHCNRDDMCSACTEGGKRPNIDGSQCIPCNIDGCVRCSEENKCGQCGGDYKLEGEACIFTKPSGGNRSGLNKEAIAGIAVAVIIVVGGLVGFLCWWFIYRGRK
ncbi:High cysteine membrane protein Group 1 [Giardia duodenalis]|uniref:High cysteine membrane protein Group 1 n=1 Tax=Giardia intestinalis (strain ATCC 50803 / WB clone C6) TaxID=184922 RepID=A8BBP7_GIAIC|nr:High cysteine membrane protein Group 1 [Giardia intestinalis]KAE8305264.1 High cysteine membrane protein Group 1 [Giardia intestinalis]|eukprot:XP_001708031.1 High cysteine membrane protein Group 1 [Giardia lamblia ATCC 50803]